MIDDRYLEMYDKELKSRCTFSAFILLIFVHEEKSNFLCAFHRADFLTFVNSVKTLENQGLVKWHSESPEDITMRKAGEDLLKAYVGAKKKGYIGSKEIGTWIDTWREIFPAGVNSGGYRYRGDRAEVLKKMIKFVNTNKHTTEQIFQATIRYVERFSLKGYEFMQQAHYFIDKKGVGSTLNAECEGLKDEGTKPEGKNYGGEIV